MEELAGVDELESGLGEKFFLSMPMFGILGMRMYGAARGSTNV